MLCLIIVKPFWAPTKVFALPINFRGRQFPGTSYVTAEHSTLAEFPRTQTRGPRGHVLLSDRTGEFPLTTDHPVDNLAGNRSRLPLPFGGDQQSVGRTDYAGFAMLAMRGHRSVASAYVTRTFELRSPISRGAPPARRSSSGVITENIFCCYRAKDLRQIRVRAI